MKTLNEFMLETERASHAGAMEMVKEIGSSKTKRS